MNHAIAIYYLCGVVASAQLGKLAALSPLTSRDLGMGLAAMAGATALLEICGAVFGGVTGKYLPRVRGNLVLISACILLAIGAACSALADTAEVFVAARMLESIGYLLVVVTAPVLIATQAPRAKRDAAMALWSTFVPVGTALGAWSYAMTAGAFGWRGAQVISITAGFALALTLVEIEHRSRHHWKATPSTLESSSSSRVGSTVWLLVAAFGAYAMAAVALLALLPSMLTEAGFTLAQAGNWTAVAALANVPASVAGAILMRKRAPLQSSLLATLLLSGGLYAFVYAPGLSPEARAMLAIGANAFSGVFACLVFALLPIAAGKAEQLSVASGKLTQFGASGALLGPPLLGAAVERWGWQSAGYASLALSVVAIPLAMIAARQLRARRGHSH